MAFSFRNTVTVFEAISSARSLYNCQFTRVWLRSENTIDHIRILSILECNYNLLAMEANAVEYIKEYLHLKSSPALASMTS